uniref:hypothetical protein n=1 Tax=Inquilinus sp. Marseille-Q2685 TaxID=2866581 RepID=UPI001CE3DAB1
MDAGTDSDLDIQATCRSLALQQIGMLTRIAEIGMRLVEAEGAKAIAQAEQPEAEQPSAPPAKDHGLAFARHAGTVQRALMQRSRAAADLCARDKTDRKARRARQRNHVTEALYALIWDPAQSIEELDEADHRTGMLHQRLD